MAKPRIRSRSITHDLWPVLQAAGFTKVGRGRFERRLDQVVQVLDVQPADWMRGFAVNLHVSILALGEFFQACDLPEWGCASLRMRLSGEAGEWWSTEGDRDATAADVVGRLEADGLAFFERNASIDFILVEHARAPSPGTDATLKDRDAAILHALRGELDRAARLFERDWAAGSFSEDDRRFVKRLGVPFDPATPTPNMFSPAEFDALRKQVADESEAEAARAATGPRVGGPSAEGRPWGRADAIARLGRASGAVPVRPRRRRKPSKA